jgi:hypothetical protein
VANRSLINKNLGENSTDILLTGENHLRSNSEQQKDFTEIGRPMRAFK